MHEFAHEIHEYINSPLEEVDVQHVPGSNLTPLVYPASHTHVVTYTTYALLMGNWEARRLRNVWWVRAGASTAC